MDYNQALDIVEDAFMKKLEAIIPEEAYKTNTLLTNQTYRATVYTDIMALGYNFGDHALAVGDIYETQSVLFGSGKELMDHINKRIAETATLYPTLVAAFSDFHKRSQVEENLKLVTYDTIQSIR